MLAIQEIIESEKSLETLFYNLDSIFQGFGNYNKENNIQFNPEYLAVNQAEFKDNKYYLDGFEIPKHCPFNYKHTIKAGTKLNGLNWSTKVKTNIVQSDQSIVLRVKSWFSNDIYCKRKN
jgi:hypothetical protein